MDPEIVAKNIDLLRHLHGRHEDLVSKLNGVVNWNQLSEFSRGKSLPTEFTLDQIELSLSLPQGWTRRDNLAALYLSVDEFASLKSILELEPSVRRALVALILEIVTAKKEPQ